MHLTHDDLAAMPQRYRATLVNCLSGYKSANLVGTVDAHGQENLAIISSAFHLGADPALIGFISRPDAVARHTLENIRATGVYTLNQVHQDMVPAAHQTSARYPREISEFEAVSLTPVYEGEIAAPYVAQSRLRLGLALRELVTIESNATVMVVGEIRALHLPETALGQDGFVDLASLASVAISGLDCYHPVPAGKRFAYAKPERAPTPMAD